MRLIECYAYECHELHVITDDIEIPDAMRCRRYNCYTTGPLDEGGCGVREISEINGLVDGKTYMVSVTLKEDNENSNQTIPSQFSILDDGLPGFIQTSVFRFMAKLRLLDI